MKTYYEENTLIFEKKSKHYLFQDLENKKFGKLIVIGFAERKNKLTCWYCKCDCGKIIKAYTNDLTTGDTTSCGYFKKEALRIRRTTHAHSIDRKNRGPSRTYITWQAMLNRCYNSNNKSFDYYGGRGIKVCERWKKFENFLEDMGERPTGLSLDRTDNEDDYYKENCQYADKITQCNNRRSNHLLNYKDKIQNITQWSKELNIGANVIRKRLRDGWSIERALTEPVNSRKLSIV